MPSTAHQTHYSQVLTNVAVEYRPPELAWPQILPEKLVTKRSDLWTIFDKSLFDVVDAKRADGAPSKQSIAGWKYAQYSCEEAALHELVTKGMRDNADSQIDLEAQAAERVKLRVQNGIEYAVFGPSGILRTAANNIYSNNENWSTLSSASPRTGIEAAIDAIEVASGVSPNVIVMTPAMGRYIPRIAEYQNERRYVTDLQNVGGMMLPTEFYGLRAVYVRSLLNLDGSYLPVPEGNATTLKRTMGDDIWIGYVNPNGIGYKDLTYGATLYTEEYAAMWWDNDHRADKIEYGMIYDQVVVAKECGALLTTVTAS